LHLASLFSNLLYYSHVRLRQFGPLQSNPFPVCVQNFADFPDQGVFGEGLVEQMRSGFKNSMAGDETIGIAGDENHLEARPF
jgi:hypothetical protein